MSDILEYLGVERKLHVKLIDVWPYGKTIPSVVDQREVQQVHAMCREYPTSCFHKLLAEVLEIENATVLDLTFGVGENYRFWKPSYLVAFDIVDWRKRGFKWVIEPDEFYETTFIKALEILHDRVFDVVYFDPPYDVHSSDKHLEKTKPWLYYGSQDLPTMIKHFPKIAKKYAKKYIIVKFMDGKKVTIFDVVNEMKSKPTWVIIYRFIRNARAKLNNKVIKTHTYYLIWKLT